MFYNCRAATLLIANFPTIKQVTMDVLEAVFIPRTIAKQMVLLMALETGMVTLNQVASCINYLLSNFSSRQRLIRQLEMEQQTVLTQDEWMDLAERIDSIKGDDVWRSDPSCPLYERDRISARVDEFVHLMRRQDIFELMFVLRGSIGRNKFGLLHEGLFSKALAGTKVLVETYHNVVCAALDFVCDAPVLPEDDPIPTDARLAFFNETRHSYGRTALLLSGGASLGFYHVGVVRCLMENRLMPRVLGGSSAGSIVCAMIGTRTDAECLNDFFESRGTDAPGHYGGKLEINFFRPHGSTERDAMAERDKETDGGDELQQQHQKYSSHGFWGVYYNTAGAFRDFKLTLQGFVPIPLRHFSSLVYDLLSGNRRSQDLFKCDTDHFRKCVRQCVGDFTFQEAFDRTGRITNIVVTPNNSSDPPRLLNYLTAPHVLVWSAAVASSSLPGVFEANRLVVKEADGWERYETSNSAGQHFSDGSLEQDLPTQQLSEMFNINHFIISQANPHAVMFASYGQKHSVWDTNSVVALLGSVMTFLKNQVRTWMANLVECIGARRIVPMFETKRGPVPTQFFTQEYEGRPSDISLVPWMHHRTLLSAMMHIIYNPSEAEFRDWIAAAERETWRFLPEIKSHIAEEMTLDRCVQRLRKRLVREAWDKQNRPSNAKMMANGGTTAANADIMGDRVPSFFNSPSLTNLGGLAITDQKSIEGLRDLMLQQQGDKSNYDSSDAIAGSTAGDGYASTHNVYYKPIHTIPDGDHNSGWGGMGLRGNRSSGNLHRATSAGSGLFIDDEEHQQHQQQGAVTTAANATGAMAGSAIAGAAAASATGATALPTHPQGAETTIRMTTRPDRSRSVGSLNDAEPDYVKTTTMAGFYYRKAEGNTSTEDLSKQSTSSENLRASTNGIGKPLR
jgi:TAG lipase / steryl ester hydrolase / phospholipase A2 / LPA acyltransferase